MKRPVKPEVSIDQAEGWALEIFKVRGSAVALPGEVDRNFLIEDRQGDRWVLKVAHAATSRQEVECQIEVLRFLATTPMAGFVPSVRPTPSGAPWARAATTADGPCFVRLVSYLEGTPMVQLGDVGAALLADVGRRLASIDLELAAFDHPGAHRRIGWDLARFLELEPYRRYLDGEMAPIVDTVFRLFADRVAPHLGNLRRSVIHNDANDHNLLTSETGGSHQVCGLIDFGDMVYSITAAEPAVAAAYAMLAAAEPLAAAGQIYAAYADVHPLTDLEWRLLPDLSIARLCASLLMSAQARSASPDDEYLQVTDRAARRLLKKLV